MRADGKAWVGEEDTVRDGTPCTLGGVKCGSDRGHGFRVSILLATVALGTNLVLPVFAQENEAPAPSHDSPGDSGAATDSDSAPDEEGPAVTKGAVEEIVVTARRREEQLEDVPISITVFNQQRLDDLNVVNASDLATFTPSLTSNKLFGDDNASFAIRGFTQEIRTSPTVGVYLAEVIAPRGGGSITAGDGAGPGSFFDLENVQVLKGPQGTLFGRNTTGGAILLVPKKPTDEWEGYFESSAGNYDMLRFQGVGNAPVHEKLRLRLGFDRQTRDGYLDNTSDVGPSHLSDVGYTAVRASMVLDLFEPLENYSIFSYLDSENDGGVNQVFACNSTGPVTLPILLGNCEDQLAGLSNDFYEVKSLIPKPKSKIEQWQYINTTTWEATDSVTVKNIISTANLKTHLNVAQFGTDFQEQTETGPIPVFFATAQTIPGIPTTSQNSFVEEFRLQGQTFDNRLEWQGGVYYEKSDPDGLSGSQSANNISCDLSTLGSDPADFRCNNIKNIFLAAVSRSIGTIEYENKAVYSQANLDILPDLIGLTGGIRYTWDETRGTSNQTVYTFDHLSEGGYAPPTGSKCVDSSASFPDCNVKLHQDSDAPTWLVGLDYNPIEESLLYAKYARGYRQGSVNILGVEGLNKFGPEKVDTYEVGTKTRFEWPFPGYFNVAGFYNDFRDQQIQFGVLATSFVPTTAIVNAGSSRIWGIETEANVEPIEGVNLRGTYTYLDTKLEDLDTPENPPGVLVTIPTAAEGDPLPFSPKHQLSLSASYLLPFVPQDFGDVTVGATFIYNDNQRAVTPSASAFATIPHYELLNFDLSWNGIMETPLDASLFATNVLSEEYWTFVSGTYGATGFESRALGQPLMVGGRLRYNFSL
jgi:iron complex outermembrane receptor protein